jgi:hypothetical protein
VLSVRSDWSGRHEALRRARPAARSNAVRVDDAHAAQLADRLPPTVTPAKASVEMAAPGMSRFAARIAANQVHARNTQGVSRLGEGAWAACTPRRRNSEVNNPCPGSTLHSRVCRRAARDATRSIARRSTKLATAPRKNAVAVAPFGTVGARSQGEPQRDRRIIPVAAWVLDGLAAGPAPAPGSTAPYIEAAYAALSMGHPA